MAKIAVTPTIAAAEFMPLQKKVSSQKVFFSATKCVHHVSFWHIDPTHGIVEH
jgi:hypothetical protein